MSLRQLESSITREAREVLQNRGLRVKDLQEWSTSPVTPREDEVAIHLPLNGVYAAFPSSCDKRKPTV